MVKAKQIKAANFKRDIVAFLAIFLFLGMVVCELVMAVWLPVYMRAENLWGRQVARQEMIDLFDSLRNRYRSIKTQDDFHEAESALMTKSLDLLAIYLRENAVRLNSDQIADIKYYLNMAEQLLERMSKKRISGELKLDGEKYLSKQLKKSEEGSRAK